MGGELSSAAAAEKGCSWAFLTQSSRCRHCDLGTPWLSLSYRRCSLVWQAQVERELAKLGPTVELKQIGQLAATLTKLRSDFGKSHAVSRSWGCGYDFCMVWLHPT